MSVGVGRREISSLSLFAATKKSGRSRLRLWVPGGTSRFGTSAALKPKFPYWESHIDD